MSSMFDKYLNIDPNYIPNNMDCKRPQREIPYNKDNLVAIIDRFNHIWGYTWSWKDTVSIPITANKTINVPDNSIIVYNSGEYPTSETEGQIGQKYYNVPDIESWTCKNITVDSEENTTEYDWVQDDQLKYVENSNTKITIEPNIEGKHLEVEILNFRRELLYSKSFDEGVASSDLDIDLDMSKDMVPGIYFIRIRLVSDTTSLFIDEYKVFINIEINWKYVDYHRVMDNILPYVDIATASEWAYDVIGECLDLYYK